MEAQTFDTPNGIAFARLAALKGMLKLEIAGLKRRGRSAYSVLRGMGYQGSRKTVLAQVQKDIENAILAKQIESTSKAAKLN